MTNRTVIKTEIVPLVNTGMILAKLAAPFKPPEPASAQNVRVQITVLNAHLITNSQMVLAACPPNFTMVKIVENVTSTVPPVLVLDSMNVLVVAPE